MNPIAYNLGSWSAFFSATTSAAAALTGLVIVAISVNTQRIIEHLHLPARGAATIASLTLVLIVGIAGLLPGQPRVALGAEVAALGMPVVVLQLWAAKLAKSARDRHNRPHREWVLWLVGGQLQALPFLIGGISLITGRGGGLYWFAFGAINSFIFAMLSMWVLLVEILR